MKDGNFRNLVFLFNALLPGLLLAIDWNTNNLGANPVEAVTRTTGVLALVFILITLCVTPLAALFKLSWLIKFRRVFGLFSFFYACVHLLTYLLFDRDGNLLTIPADVWKRPFIAIGMICFVLMVPLALTSTNAMIRRLGIKRWRRLHQFTYVIAIGGVIHFWMIVKSDISYPLLFAVAVGALLGQRLWASFKRGKAH